ncbi:MAG: LPS export ABC transporter periplasmic protein LptC [Gammaproteobacteria bacterium]
MRPSLIVVVLIAGLVAIAAGWIYQSRSLSLATRPELDIPTDIDYFMADFKYRSIDETGNLDYQFQSPYLEHYIQNDTSKIEAPVVLVFEPDGDWRLKADIGELYHPSNTMLLSDNVVMQKMGNDPILVRSESIFFEPDLDLVSLEQSLVIESFNAIITADEAVFDLDNQVYKLKNIKAIYYDQNS